MLAFPATDAAAVRITRTFRAKRERVFRAWTNPEELKRWWGPAGFVTPAAEIDLRVGGQYCITMQAPSGNRFRLSGTYVEVAPPERLVMTWSWNGTMEDDGHESLVTLEFHAKGDGTEVRVHHERLPAGAIANHEAGWNGSIDRLEALLLAAA